MRRDARFLIAAAVAAVFASANVAAQKPTVVRQLGTLEHVTKDSLASAAQALPMSGGRVLVNDITGRRVLLFDSTLAHPTVVADTTAATANAYGFQGGGLIRYRGDSTLFVDVASLSMLVIAPAGTIVRTMAIPRPNDAYKLIGNFFGTPGFDARGRLVYFGGGGLGGGRLALCCLGFIPLGARGSEYAGTSDSAFVIRADLATRTSDSVTVVRNPKIKTIFTGDARGLLTSIVTTQYPLPVLDGAALCRDGTLAIVRGRDYHVDWLNADERWTSSPKLPFDWQRVDDNQKRALIDSSIAAEQELAEKIAAMRGAASARPSVGSGRGGGRGGAGTGAAASEGQEIPNIIGRPEPNELPDYFPPFGPGAVSADGDCNLWIRTSTMTGGQPVYDIVNRRGELIDRVQLPSFRTIAGFGPGVVYMAVKDSAGVVHLERARVK